jgi:GxxExxY protein
LRAEGFSVLTQVPLPLVYREVTFDVGYRLDLLVEDLVVVEIKSVDALAAIHQRNCSRTSSLVESVWGCS